MNYENLKIDISNGLAVITFNRPQALNALNSKTFTELNSLLDDISKRTEIKVVIFTGEGKAFIAGADIAEMSEMNPEQAKKFAEIGQNTFHRMEMLPIPVIAAINGYALGGGCELSLACDIRIASTFAKFGQPEVNLGLIPGYAGTARLPRIVGLSNALYLLTSAEVISADEALRMGLVQKVVDPDQLMAEATALAAKIAAKGSLAVRKVKEVTRKGMLTDFDTARKNETAAFSSLFGNGESGEGMKAFLEKRKPNW